MDRISDLPDNAVDRILCSLPILDAVKTCILSTAWRYKWVGLSKLTFNDKSCTGIKSGDVLGTYRFVKIVTSAVLQHVGPLHEFHLQVPCSFKGKSEILIPSIQFVLRKYVKTLSLQRCVVPACIYSSTELTHLELLNYVGSFSPPASCGGLPNLVSFKLATPGIIVQDPDNIMKFISSCSKLKRFSLCTFSKKAIKIHAPTLEYLYVKGYFPCICFLEIGHLKKLYVRLKYANFCLAEKCRMMNIFSCLVNLEYLKLKSYSFQLLVSAGVPRRLSQMLDQLKILELTSLTLWNSDELCGLLCLLASSPKLLKLSIGTSNRRCEEELDFQSYAEYYKDHKFESLCTVILDIQGTTNIIEMIDLLLGCSPNLEVMSIKYPFAGILDASKEVNRLARASSKARVNFV